jgi:hypothetical protein
MGALATGRRAPRPAAVDPWEVLRSLRAHPFIEATTTDDDINGGDAVDVLGELRATLDDALAHAPRRRRAR